ncbi:MAG TPA: hypothetical protein VFC00_30735 [Micromonosporaceae bacterium]|nr:hypothetical protein [Micromonosporaceae bacterium]
MPVEAFVSGHDGFNRLAAACHKTAAVDYDRELNQGLENAGEVVAKEIRNSSKTFMPDGYEEVFEASTVTKVTLAVHGLVRKAKVAIRAFGRRGHDRQVEQLEKGRLKHPVFGRGNAWVWQKIRPGFVSVPAKRATPKAAREIDKACEKIADKLERAI